MYQLALVRLFIVSEHYSKVTSKSLDSLKTTPHPKTAQFDLYMAGLNGLSGINQIDTKIGIRNNVSTHIGAVI